MKITRPWVRTWTERKAGKIMYQGIEVADETFWIGTNDYETSLFV